MKYSIELITASKEYYWDDNLNERQLNEAIKLYLSFGGRVRVWQGMRFICQYEVI